MVRTGKVVHLKECKIMEQLQTKADEYEVCEKCERDYEDEVKAFVDQLTHEANRNWDWPKELVRAS